MKHSWARLVQSFVNVEGAGAGGRPNLFRSSSAQITWAFKSAAHPHGSSLFSDAFKIGLIRSTTDYEVYTRAGIPGADYAFYTGRQKYHTMDDSISSLHDRRPLWAMMENLHGVVSKLASEPSSNDSQDRHFVYFDCEPPNIRLVLLLKIVLCSIRRGYLLHALRFLYPIQHIAITTRSTCRWPPRLFAVSEPQVLLYTPRFIPLLVRPLPRLCYRWRLYCLVRRIQSTGE
jgi:hypothetical protein